MGNPLKSPIRRLYNACTTPSSRNAHLLLGHKGCGKSTELHNLKRDFNNAGHPVHMIHANLESDLHRITHWDILLLITDGLCQIARDTETPIHDTTLEALYAMLKTDMKLTETRGRSVNMEASGGVELNMPPVLRSVLNLFVSLKGSIKAGTNIIETVEEEMKKKASDWLMYTAEISSAIKDKCNLKEPIIIFEDLDRLPEPAKIFELLSYSVLSQMPFPVIYTFPISQCYAPKYPETRASFTAHTLPMIKVSDFKNRAAVDEGLRVIRNIVELRADLCLFDEPGDVLNMLIKKTGGSLRHLFECINHAAEMADWDNATKIEPTHANSALEDLRIELTKTLGHQEIEMLKAMYDDDKLRKQIGEKELLLQMMNASVILEYQNGGHWHDLHPLVADYLDELGPVPTTETGPKGNRNRNRGQ